MPWIVPAHQAPVLPLKRWRPAWFSGLALALGSVTPDLVFILRLDETGSPASHTFEGQVLITMPLVVALHALATLLVLPWLLPRVPGGAPLHLHVLARCQPPASLSGVAKVAVSGLIGGLTHVAIDGFTHGDHSGWALPLLPALGTPLFLPWGASPAYEVLQVVLSVVLGVAGLRAWERMAGALPSPGPGAAARWEVSPAPAAQCRTTAGLFLIVASLGALAAPFVKGAIETPDALKLAAYGAITACCAAAVTAALVDRARRALERVRLDVALWRES
jgi:hypothetical protein